MKQSSRNWEEEQQCMAKRDSFVIARADMVEVEGAWVRHLTSQKC